MKENKRKIIGFLSVCALLCAIAPTIVRAAEEGEAISAVYATAWALLPPIVAIVLAVTYLNYNSSTIHIATLGINVTLPPVLFGILTVILVWTSINVTNCADGVDGLSGTLALITLMTVYVIDSIRETAGSFSYLILLFGICILGYLWYNATPSKLLMGDAGSRALGFFIGSMVIISCNPFLFIATSTIMFLNGGTGLLKVFLLRFFKIKIFSKVRFPLHDHLRKNKGWSPTQVLIKFMIMQILITIATIGILLKVR